MKIDKTVLAEKLFGSTEKGSCVICKKSVDVKTDFKDKLSITEWGLSQLCQQCQDETFG